MSYEQAMKWAKKHPKGIKRMYMGFDTSGTVWTRPKEKPRPAFHVSRGAIASTAWRMLREGYDKDRIRRYIREFKTEKERDPHNHHPKHPPCGYQVFSPIGIPVCNYPGLEGTRPLMCATCESETDQNRRAKKAAAKVLAPVLLLPLLLQGCFFAVLPVGTIARAIHGPHYCIEQGLKAGDRVRMPSGKPGVVTAIDGEDRKACAHPVRPIRAHLREDERE